MLRYCKHRLGKVSFCIIIVTLQNNEIMVVQGVFFFLLFYEQVATMDVRPFVL